MILAVYGTLRRDGGAHIMLKLLGARFIGCGWVNGFKMVAGRVPYALRGRGRVRVEVYEVEDDKVPILDFYESGYVRREVDVEMDDGGVVRAQMYVWEDEEVVRNAEEVMCGDWVRHVKGECGCSKKGLDRSS